MFGNLFGCRYQGECESYNPSSKICNGSCLSVDRNYCGIFRERDEERKRLWMENLDVIVNEGID